MRNFERIKAMTLEELAKELCNLQFSMHQECTEECPFFMECWDGHNGARAWLKKKEVK